MRRLAFASLTVAVFSARAAAPNILHIHTDDHRPDGLHALGTEILQTPNLDTLVATGTTFTRAYTQGSMIGAVCTPSRTMLLTGRSWQRIPGAPGAAANANDPATFLPKIMAAAGYETWHMGKGGNAFTPGIKAFETCILEEKADHAGASRRLADQSIDFLKGRAAKADARPFYMYLAPPVPHDPRDAEPQFHKLYIPSKIPLSPSFMPVHPFDNGEMAVRDEKLAPWPRTPENTRAQLADYYACLTGLDHHAGRIFEHLKETGQWENTLVVFSGDNGLSMGEHGLFGKQNLYEFGGMHVPLVIAGPLVPKATSDALVYLMDLYPTFADYGGAKVPAGVDGKSLRPVIEGKATGVREVLTTGYRNCMRAIRDDRWKLIRYPLVDRTQLFDLKTDPRELRNLADDPAQAAKVKELTALLAREMTAYGDTHPLQVDNPLPADWTPPVSAGAESPGKSPQEAKPRGKKKLHLESVEPAPDPGLASPPFSNIASQKFNPIQPPVPTMSIRLLPLALSVLSLAAFAQTEAEKTWPRHSMERPRPEVVEPQYDGKPVPAPAGAVVLFDGTSLTKWKQEPPKNAVDTSGKPLWAVKDGCMEITPKSGFLRTIEALPGSFNLHIEWATPAEVKGNGQGRGNSGVFIDGFPEVQVLDSWKNDTYPDGQAAGLYGQHPPRVNACKAPGEWQCYDIRVERAVLKDGKVERPARLSVKHNGILVQENREFGGTQREGKLGFQDHGNPVRYRNIWYAPLP